METPETAPLSPPTSLPPEPEAAPADLAEETALGSTPAGIATNKTLRAMSRAARSFLLYDPSNEAIRAFLSDYR